MAPLFISADPEALKGTASAHLAKNVVMIRADQPYAAALAEVRELYGLAEDAYTCSFIQHQPERNRSVIVAKSAWTFIEPNSDLELLVIPLVKLDKDKRTGDAERSSIARAMSPAAEPQLVQAASQAASSVVAPATPSNTDHSDSEVSDSDDEGGIARAQQLSGSQRGAHVRDRSNTPSPSNRSCKAALRQQIERAERDALPSSSPHADSPIRQDQPQRFRTLTPPSQSLDPALLRFSVDSHSSFRIGLDDTGEVAFVPPSPIPLTASLPTSAQAGPSRSAKGKERAFSPEQGQGDESQEEARPVKPEPRSSQPGPSFTFAPPAPPRVALKAHSSTLADASFSSDGTSSALTSLSGSSGSNTSSRLSTESSDLSTDSQGSSGVSKLRSPTRPAPTVKLQGLKRPPPTVEDTPRKRLQRTQSQQIPRSPVAGPSSTITASPARSSSNASLPASAARSSGRKNKTLAEKRAEALARPRVEIPHESRSGRFHYYLRLPDWPTAPRNAGPLKDIMFFKQGARGEDTLGQTVQFVFEAAAKETGWKVDDLRLTFCSRDADGNEGRESIWGWDKLLTGFRDLEEIGLKSGDVVDIDHRSGIDAE
ncbi:hypothetical protein JCM10450v2_003076 [Rhodotorula kratochvilovae]